MDLGTHRWPRWAAPAVGLAVGILAGLYVTVRTRHGTGWWPVMGAGMGLLAGFVVWFLDAPPPKGGPSTERGRNLCLLAWATVWVPGAGVLTGLAAFVANRTVESWPNRASRCALALALLLAGAIGALSLLAR